MLHHPQHCSVYFLQTQDILLHNCNATIKIRKLSWIHHCHLIVTPHSSLDTFTKRTERSNPKSHVALSFHVFLVSFSLQHFFSAPLIIPSQTKASHFVECPPVWVCLCPRDYIQVIHLW